MYLKKAALFLLFLGVGPFLDASQRGHRLVEWLIEPSESIVSVVKADRAKIEQSLERRPAIPGSSREKSAKRSQELETEIEKEATAIGAKSRSFVRNLPENRFKAKKWLGEKRTEFYQRLYELYDEFKNIRISLIGSPENERKFEA